MIRAEAGARGYRLIGLDIGIEPGVTQLANLVELGSGRTPPSNVKPSDIVIDRCYLHGNDVGELPARRRDERHPAGGGRLVSRELPRREQRLAGDRRMERCRARSRSSTTSSRRPARTSCSAASDPAIDELVPADIEIRAQPQHQAAVVAERRRCGQERVRAEERAPRAGRGQHLRATCGRRGRTAPRSC